MGITNSASGKISGNITVLATSASTAAGDECYRIDAMASAASCVDESLSDPDLSASGCSVYFPQDSIPQLEKCIYDMPGKTRKVDGDDEACVKSELELLRASGVAGSAFYSNLFSGSRQGYMIVGNVFRLLLALINICFPNRHMTSLAELARKNLDDDPLLRLVPLSVLKKL